jgi:hypothetical protein
LNPIASNYLVRGRCDVFQAVSKRCETAKLLKGKENRLSVSLFHDFPERAIGNSNPSGFRLNSNYAADFPKIVKL